MNEENYTVAAVSKYIILNIIFHYLYANCSVQVTSLQWDIVNVFCKNHWWSFGKDTTASKIP